MRPGLAALGMSCALVCGVLLGVYGTIGEKPIKREEVNAVFARIDQRFNVNEIALSEVIKKVSTKEKNK